MPPKQQQWQTATDQANIDGIKCFVMKYKTVQQIQQKRMCCNKIHTVNVTQFI